MVKKEHPTSKCARVAMRATFQRQRVRMHRETRRLADSLIDALDALNVARDVDKLPRDVASILQDAYRLANRALVSC
jgi:hypothetical protein